MRLSVCIPMFFRDISPAEAVSHISALGFDAAEVWKLKDSDAPALSEALSRCGVELAAMCTDCFALTEPHRRQEYLEGLEAACRRAQLLRCKNLITQSGQDTGKPAKEQLSAMEETLTAALPILEAYGMRLLLEPLNRRIDHKDTFLSSSADAFDLLRRIGSPRICVLFDLYHQHITGENLADAATQNLPYIGHMHLAGSRGRHEFWEGEVDYPALLRQFDAAGYTGLAGLEYSPLLPREESLTRAKNLLI